MGEQADEARQIAAMVGEMTGRPDLASAILAGELTADEVIPVISGMVDGAVRSLAVPIIRARSWTGFIPADRPMSGIITMLDGTQVRITLEEVK